MKFSLVSLKLVCQRMKSYNYFNVIMGFHTDAECTITLGFGNEFEKGHRKVINWVSWADIKSLIQEGPEGRGHMAAERPPLENARTAI